MDQLRTILAWLKRNHFWVLSGLVALIAIACWWKASGTLSSEFTANKQSIDSEFNSLSAARSKAFLPNQPIIDKQKEQINAQANQVAATWQKLYDRQREHVLEWPDDLSQEFRDFVEKKKFGDDIPRHLLNDYQNYARRYFPELPAIVGAPVLDPAQSGGYGGEGLGGGRGAYSGGGRNPYGGGIGEGGAAGQLQQIEEDFICEWLDQGLVREALIFPQRPSALQVWVTQEDLWVYKTLLNVIRRTNEAAGATRQSNAAVRIIYSLEVGKQAAVASRGTGRILMRASAAPSEEGALGVYGGGERGVEGDGGSPYAGYDGAPTGDLGMDRGRMGGAYGEAGGPMSPEQERGALLSFRYLGPDGKPIPYGGGGGDVGADPYAADPAAAAVPASPLDLSVFGVEYKRLPVRMTLQMDQRWLTHLISECANQPLQVEVQEVRINVAGTGTSGGERGAYGGGGAYGGAGAYGGGYGGGRGAYGGGRGEGGGAGGQFTELAGIQAFPAQPNIVDVVIQGIIYIFNEPNPNVLKTSDESQLASTM